MYIIQLLFDFFLFVSILRFKNISIYVFISNVKESGDFVLILEYLESSLKHDCFFCIVKIAQFVIKADRTRHFRHTDEGIVVDRLLLSGRARGTITRDIFIDPRGYVQ